MQPELLVSRRASRISLTPLIDVVFILLLFFMLSTRFQHWQALPLTSIEAGTGTRSGQSHRILVSAQGQLRLGDSVIALASSPVDFQRWLGQRVSEVLLLQPSADVTTQTLVQALDALRKAGAHQVSLLPLGSAP